MAVIYCFKSTQKYFKNEARYKKAVKRFNR